MHPSSGNRQEQSNMAYTSSLVFPCSVATSGRVPPQQFPNIADGNPGDPTGTTGCGAPIRLCERLNALASAAPARRARREENRVVRLEICC
mmetsp:Transcript_28633/g.68835  ORF Transcript_28633/g.68835 Transcript_28633/m.68835 type:complete len:91 (+) Transcript_28633:330-602(+)